MKKLNKKGFTLVELLAVIIILAIVVGITIPAVLTTISNTRDTAFQAAVNTVADWIDRQYQANLVGDPDIAVVDTNFSSNCTINASTGAGSCTVNAALLAAAGVKPDNFTTTGSTITIASTGRSCVTLKGNASGDYRVSTTKTGGICS